MINTFDNVDKSKKVIPQQQPIKDLTPEEVQLELLKIAKEDSIKLESIKTNVKFFAWYLIFSIILAIIFWGKIQADAGSFMVGK